MVLIILCAVLLIVAVLGFVIRRHPAGGATVSGMSITDIADRYRPMERLLDEDDFQVLNATGDGKLLRRIRSQRRSIFRGYLRCLRRDHAMLCATVRSLMIDSETDQKDLATALLKIEWTFKFFLVGVNVRLACHAIGFGTVDVSGLLGSLDEIRQHMQALTRTPLVSGAAA
jgi:hypothetical protein